MIDSAVPTFLKKSIVEVDDMQRVAIVGTGPKGTYALERLVTQLSVIPTHQPIEIYLFNQCTYFGAGNIYRPDQPTYLLMNYTNSYINMWTEVAPKSVVPERLSLLSWLQKQRSAKANGYAARSEVGAYLQEGLQQIIAHAPANITIKKVTATVIDIQAKSNRYKLTIYKNEKSEVLPFSFNQVLLTTGHPPPQRNFSDSANERRISFIYPVRDRLSDIVQCSHVAIKGMGLTFIDAALALTEGRGGHFKKLSNGKLKYLPSGNEPTKIYPFSRSGLPMIPRSATTRATVFLPLRYFTAEWVEGRQRKSKVDFEKDILPLLKLEMRWAYYHVYFSLNSYSLSFNNENELDQQIQYFHTQHSDIEPFSFNKFWNPLANFSVKTPVERHLFTTNLLDKYTTAASKGLQIAPIAAMATVWKQVAPLFRKLYNFGGLTARSQRYFSHRFAGHLNRISYGPPLLNAQKIGALAKAEILDFSYAQLKKCEWNEMLQKFIIQPLFSEQTVNIDYLIDARIPRPNLQNTTSELYRNMLATGLIRPFTNADRGGSFSPGSLDISKKTGHVINIKGEISTQIAAYGTPTEGITYDNDSLSRQCNNFADEWAKVTAFTLKNHKATSHQLNNL